MIWRWLMPLLDDGMGRYLNTIHRVGIESWVPTWLLPFFCLGIISLVIWQYLRVPRLSRRRRGLLMAVRILAYFSVLFMLVRPVLEIEGEGALPGPLPLIVDGTESMTITDVDGESRISAVEKSSRDLISANRYPDELKLTPYWAGGEFRRLDFEDELPDPDGDYTSLARMLEHANRESLGEYCPGIILLSDGAHNSREVLDNALSQLKQRGVPVFTSGFGKENSRDVAVTYILGEEVVFLDEKAKLYVNLSQSGYPGQQVDVRLRLGETEVYRGRHQLPENEEISLPLEYIPPAAGSFPLTAEVEPLPGEVTIENNRYIKQVRVIDEKIRILMVFGYPSWEYRYLMGAFERDDRVEVKVYLSLVDPRLFRRRGDEVGYWLRELPADVDRLNGEYDIVFMSRIDSAMLPSSFLAALPGFVRDHGGSLAILSDPSYLPMNVAGTVLEEMLPVTLSGDPGRTYQEELFSDAKSAMRFSLTEDGLGHRLTAFSGSREENRKIWEELPEIYHCYKPGRVKPAAISLASVVADSGGEAVPAIVYHSYGMGTVLHMGFDSTWRWRKEYGDRYFRDFWGKVVQFLGLPHLLGESAQSAIFIGRENCIVGEQIVVRAKVSNPNDFSPYMSEDGVEVSVLENDLARELQLSPVPNRPGIYRGVYLPEQQGKLTLSLPEQFAARPVELQVGRRQLEFINSGMNLDLLKKIADETGGSYFPPGQEAELLTTLYRQRPMEVIRVLLSLWDSLALLLLSLLLFSLEWLLRKLFYLD